LTAQWTAIPDAPAPVVVPTPVVPVGPPPSVLKTITNPKISRDDKGYYCHVGKYVFLREGRTEETPKLTTQVFSLLSNGKVIDSEKSALDKVLFAKSDTYLESTLTCQVAVGQESTVSTSYSFNSADIGAFTSVRKSAIEAADVKYFKDREDAYAKKDKEFLRLAVVRSAAVIASKSSKEISAASSNYQKAYKAASELWKKELADASTNRVLARDLAQENYLASLEAAGISIYPTPVKAVVTPTPTPTPTPKATPTPTPTPVATTNPQPTAQMVKVGTVYMASGSYFLNDSTKITLKAIALKINASDAKSVLVYGHTDSRGGVNNTALSQKRAKAVANYLRPLLTGKKITIGWYASRKPVAGGNSAADLAKNRRVEVYSK
jgi:outer membrane protein OmpA-like peptidoglycan-associated protein